VPMTLTNTRTAGAIASMISSSFGNTITAAQVNPAALDLLNATLPNGQFLIPTPPSPRRQPPTCSVTMPCPGAQCDG